MSDSTAMTSDVGAPGDRPSQKRVETVFDGLGPWEGPDLALAGVDDAIFMSQ